MTELFNFQNTWFYFAINRIIQELYSHLLTLNHLWFSLLFIWPVFHRIIISTSKAPFNQSSGYWWGYQGFKPTELLSASPGSAYGASRRGKPYRGPPRVTLRTSFVHFENEYAQQQQLQRQTNSSLSILFSGSQKSLARMTHLFPHCYILLSLFSSWTQL